MVIKTLRKIYRFFLLPFSIFLFWACPEQEESLECGPHQIVIDGECQCEEGYHWNDDHTKCVIDTTSHAFVWEALVGGSTLCSSFNGVEIIAPDDIWAVGELFTDERDSNGKIIKYNAAHFDGNNWALEKIIVRDDHLNDGVYYIELDSSGQDLSGVFKVDNEIWFMEGGQRVRLIDGQWDYFPVQPYWPFEHSAYRLWGTSKNNIFITGRLGEITHYDGENFHHQDLGTDIPLRDIYGLDENHIWVTGLDRSHWESVIYCFDGVNWSTKHYFSFDDPNYDGSISSDTLNGYATSVWAYGDTVYFTSRNGVWKESISTGEGTLIPSAEISEDGFYPFFGIRGTGYNDIIVIGQDSRIYHYNGKNWARVGNIIPQANLITLDMIDDTVVIVGHTASIQALIIQGRR